MKSIKKIFGLLLVAVLAIALFVFLRHKALWNTPNVAEIGNEDKLFIATGASYEEHLEAIKPFIKDWDKFVKAADKENLNVHLIPGRYTLVRDWTNRELIDFLKTGMQDEIPLRIGNYYTVMQMANRITPFLEMDSLSLMKAFEASAMTKDLKDYQWIYFIIPDTYNFYWSTSPEDFVKRMEGFYNDFWTEDRKQKAENMGFTPYQVMTMASIVQLESYQEEEQPTVAGVYLNRHKIGMKLDADPTVIFAHQVENPEEERLKRVYYKHLNSNNPYNTYRHVGLPPGPICAPNPSAIDAVLNAEKHDYIYFVADPAKAGYHIFANTYAEHLRNVAKYRAGS